MDISYQIIGNEGMVCMNDISAEFNEDYLKSSLIVARFVLLTDSWSPP